MLTTTRTMTIEWGDCDPAGIVFFPRYLAFFDTSTTMLFEAALGMRKIDYTKHFGIVGCPMVDLRTRFLRPSRYGDVATITSTVAAFRRSSFDVEHRLVRDGALCVEGFETRVWTAADPDVPAGIRSAPIPAAVIAAFQAA